MSAFDDLLDTVRPASRSNSGSVESADDLASENLSDLAELAAGQRFTFTTIELYGSCPCDAYVTHVGVVDMEDGRMAIVGYCSTCAQTVGPALQRLKTT